MLVTVAIQPLLAGLALAGVAVDIAERNSIAKRDPCDGKNASPILYHTYGTNKCKPKWELNKDGKCYHGYEMWFGCEAFCQTETTYVYGVEQPFGSSYCHEQSCSISSSESRSVSWSFSLSPKLNKFLKAFKVGVSGGASWSTSTATARSFSKNLEKGQCGYFTFVPVIRKSCGRVGASPSCTARARVDEALCGETLKLLPDGKVDGVTIFVRTDCNTRMPLGKEEQNAVYNNPGVPLDRGLQAAWASTFAKNDLDGAKESDITCEVSDKSPSVEDCAPLFEDEQSANVGVSAGVKGHSYWPYYKTGCALALEFQSDWKGDRCDLTYGDVNVAALSIAAKCSKDGKVGGRRAFGRGKCKGQIKFIVPKGLPPSPS